MVTSAVGAEPKKPVGNSAKNKAKIKVVPTVKVVPTIKVVPTTIKVVPANFSIRLLGNERSVSAGTNASYTFTVSAAGGQSGRIVFDVPNLPNDITATITPATARRTYKLDLKTMPTVALGSAVYALRGRLGSRTQTAPFRLTVIAPPATAVTGASTVPTAGDFSVIRRVGPFTMTLAPATLITPQGIDASTTLTIAPPGGQTFLPEVNIEVIAAPPGVTVLTPVTNGPTTKLILSTNGTTTPGVYILNIVGRSGPHTQTVALQLTVTTNVPGFGLSAHPNTQTVPRGAVAVYNITASNTGGFNGQITYGLVGLPATATAAFELIATGLTVRITTTAATAPTTYPLQITGKSGSLTATIPVDLVVTALAT